MSIVIGADAAGLRLKEVVKDFLKETSTLWMLQLKVKTLLMYSCCCAEVNKEEQNLGIVIDAMVLVLSWSQQNQRNGCC